MLAGYKRDICLAVPAQLLLGYMEGPLLRAADLA